MFKIGNIKIESPLFLAPMAGVTDHPFRVIVRDLVQVWSIQNL